MSNIEVFLKLNGINMLKYGIKNYDKYLGQVTIYCEINYTGDLDWVLYFSLGRP